MQGLNYTCCWGGCTGSCSPQGHILRRSAAACAFSPAVTPPSSPSAASCPLSPSRLPPLRLRLFLLLLLLLLLLQLLPGIA